MQQWITQLDNILSVGNRPLLSDAGTVSHQQAIEKATQEFETYRRKEMLQYESDFDRAIRALKGTIRQQRKRIKTDENKLDMPESDYFLN